MKAKAPAAEFLAANEASMDAIHALAAEGLEHADALPRSTSRQSVPPPPTVPATRRPCSAPMT